MNNFQSKDGITIAEVRTELTKQKSVIERDKAYTCRRWIVTIDNKDKFYIRYIPTMGEMLKELKTKKVLNFCKEHEAAQDGKTKKDRKEKKEKVKVVKTLKKEKKVRGPQVAELEAKHIDLVLQRMAIGISKEEKDKLKVQLVAIREEILANGGSIEIGSSTTKKSNDMSKEGMAEAARYGMAKAAEKKAARGNKNKTVQLKPTAAKGKKAKSVEDLFDVDDNDEDFVVEKVKKVKPKVKTKPKAKTKAKVKGKK